ILREQRAGRARGIRLAEAESGCSANLLALRGARVVAIATSARWGGVYLRHTVVRKGGRAHTYWRLVRSVRRGKKVVQETVAHLGELDGEGRARARLLAQEITGRADQRELFEGPHRGSRPSRCGSRGSASSGDARLAMSGSAGRCGGRCASRSCAALLPPGREAVPWAQVAAVLVS